MSIMKIKMEDLPVLMDKHLHELTEDELHGLAFIGSIEIEKYFSNVNHVNLKIKNGLSVAFVECSRGMNILTMGRTNRTRNGMRSLVSFGGMKSFKDMVIIFRNIIRGTYEMSMISPGILEVYSKEEWEPIFSYFFDEAVKGKIYARS